MSFMVVNVRFQRNFCTPFKISSSEFHFRNVFRPGLIPKLLIHDLQYLYRALNSSIHFCAYGTADVI